MLQLIATGKCEGCPIADPEPVSFYAGGQKIISGVKCSHEALCDHIEEFLTGRLKENDSGDLT